MPRHAARKDSNHSEIQRELAKRYIVHDCSRMAFGMTDMIVELPITDDWAVLVLVEDKDTGGKLTAAQKLIFQKFERSINLIKVETLNEALEKLHTIREQILGRIGKGEAVLRLQPEQAD